MKTIKQTYMISAPPSAVFRALVERTQIEEWTGSPAVMDDRVGTNFSLWGDSILGTNLEVVPDAKLVQRWRASDWLNDSRVTFILLPDAGGTRVELLHEEVPDDQAEEYAAGWNDSYFGPLKEYLEET